MGSSSQFISHPERTITPEMHQGPGQGFAVPPEEGEVQDDLRQAGAEETIDMGRGASDRRPSLTPKVNPGFNAAGAHLKTISSHHHHTGGPARLPAITNGMETTGDRNHHFDPEEGPVMGDSHKWAGFTTLANPDDDKMTGQMLAAGLGKVDNGQGTFIPDAENEVPLGSSIIPISPMHPFIRMNPFDAQTANLLTYNRAKLPIQDLEHRKAFRHIFFGRPECYVMSSEGVLADQCANDEDFASAITRTPHLLQMLSPMYIEPLNKIRPVHSSRGPQPPRCNWNYLLSNRCQGLASVAGNELKIDENTTRTLSGFTISPGMTLDSRQGASINLSFRDTKNLEVFDFFRLWMLYIHKRKRGIFAPPFNGYQRTNQFFDVPKEGGPIGGDWSNGRSIFQTGHPYDRALEYCIPIFDVITNESMTKIIYWCKYYGNFPTELECTGLGNDNNEALTQDMITNVTFKYHYKLENVNKSLLEFNHNSGIVNCVGSMVDGIRLHPSHPFIIRTGDPDNSYLNYAGAAGMFTGTPFIVMETTGENPFSRGSVITTPRLCFQSLSENMFVDTLNRGLTNTFEIPTTQAVQMI